MTTPTADFLPADQRADYDLASRYQPVLRLDAAEPYPPSVMGYSVFRETRQSLSCKFTVVPMGAATIEYAVWYDWDIGHLYDLEHVWVHVDSNGSVVAVEASFHGQRILMDLAGGLPAMEGDRPVLFVEPGKHAHWADGTAMAVAAAERIRAACGGEAGAGAVHRGNLFFEAGLYTSTPLADRLATRKMQRDAFVPRFCFTRTSEDGPLALKPWAELSDWIPGRVTQLCAQLPVDVPHLAAVFLDCGDTLIDESSENKRPGTEVVLDAEEIPGAMAAVRDLHSLGYPIVLMADGPVESFENLLKPRGIWDLMAAHVISGDMGELKPSPKMFAAGMQALDLTEADRARVVMVGNNLARDIRGANDFGLHSVFVGWSKRRSHAPDGPSEMPDSRINRLDQLVDTIAAIELALEAETADG